jgi:hypothetical protein
MAEGEEGACREREMSMSFRMRDAGESTSKGQIERDPYMTLRRPREQRAVILPDATSLNFLCTGATARYASAARTGTTRAGSRDRTAIGLNIR